MTLKRVEVVSVERIHAGSCSSVWEKPRTVETGGVDGAGTALSDCTSDYSACGGAVGGPGVLKGLLGESDGGHWA